MGGVVLRIMAQVFWCFLDLRIVYRTITVQIYKTKNLNYLIVNRLRFLLVLEAGLEPARTLLLIGF